MSTHDYGPKTPTAKELAWRFETVRTMSGTQFELYVAALLRAMGHNTRVLGGSGDQGVDLIVDYFGERVAVQCKNYAKPVGNKPVQEVYTGAKHHGGQQAWVVAPAGFTNGAFELARSVGVKLFAAGAIRAWIGEVDKVASPQPRSESFPPTYPTSKLRRQDSESYPKLLDDYEMRLTRLERVRAADVLTILRDTQAHIHEIRRQLDAFEKLGTGTLEQKQRYDQLNARYAQIQETADQEARKRVDEAASPQPRSEMFPPTSEQRKQDNERYHAILDLYELELTRLERAHNRRSKPSVVQTLVDTQARIHYVRKELDAFEKLGTESLEQKQRHAQLNARHEQIQEQIQEKAGQELRKRHRRGWRSGRWRASEDPLVLWGCAWPSVGCLVIAFVCSIAVLNEMFFGGSFGEGLVYGLVVIGGFVLLVYAAAKYYS